MGGGGGYRPRYMWVYIVHCTMYNTPHPIGLQLNWCGVFIFREKKQTMIIHKAIGIGKNGECGSYVEDVGAMWTRWKLCGKSGSYVEGVEAMWKEG